MGLSRISKNLSYVFWVVLYRFKYNHRPNQAYLYLCCWFWYLSNSTYGIATIYAAPHRGLSAIQMCLYLIVAPNNLFHPLHWLWKVDVFSCFSSETNLEGRTNFQNWRVRLLLIQAVCAQSNSQSQSYALFIAYPELKIIANHQMQSCGLDRVPI